MTTGHNGGPPLDIDAKMRWVRINISDILEGMNGLNWEQRGFYCTMLFKMYARQSGIPSDDKAGASVIGCNPRTFRVHRDHLVAAGKLYDDEGTLKNKRVEREISDFCREVKRRREAALEREKRRREAAPAEPVQLELEPNSPPIQTEFDPNLARTETTFAPNWDEKANENNVCTATAVVKEKHNTGGNQKPETRNHKESNSPPVYQHAADGPDEIPGLNGSTSLIVTTFATWLNPYVPDIQKARETISDAVGIYGDAAVRDAFTDLKADITDGKLRIPSAKAFYGYVKTAKARGPRGVKKPFRPTRFA